MATLTTARGGSSDHMDALPWKMLEPIGREGEPDEEEELVVMTEDKLLLEERRTQVPIMRREYGTAVKQPFQLSKRKGKSVPKGPTFGQPSIKHTSRPIKGVPEGTRAMSGVNTSAERKRIGGNSKYKPACSTQPSQRIIERKLYSVEMDEGEYESLEVFKTHTCKPQCGRQYFVCEKKALAVELHFKKFMKSIFGSESAKMVQGLEVEYIYFMCDLTDEEAKILEGKPGVVKVELVKDLGGMYF